VREATSSKTPQNLKVPTSMKNIRLSLLIVASLAVIASSPSRAISQEEVSPENMCGALALTCAARAAGATIDVEDLVDKLPINGKMKSFSDLIDAARQLGLATKVVRWRAGQLRQVNLPCIVRLVPKSGTSGAHYIVLIAAEHGAVRVIDPPQRPIWITDEELFREWDGVALYVAPDAATMTANAPLVPALDERSAIGLTVVGAMILVGFTIRLWTSKQVDQVSYHFPAVGKLSVLSPDRLQRTCRALRLNVGVNTVHVLSSRNHAAPHGKLRQIIFITAMGWIAIAVGLAWAITDAWGTTRKNTIVVDQASQIIDVKESSLKLNGQVAKTKFMFTNRGDRPAKIVAITPNCSCVQVIATSHTVPPGGKVEIQAGVNLEGDINRQAKLLVELEDTIPQRLMLRLSARRVAD